MKNIITDSLKSILAIILIVSVFSCQNDIDILEPDPNNTDTMTSSSLTANLIQQTSANDGSFDNILDGYSCGNVVLPVTVFVNGIEIIINSEEDFAVIEKIFDAFDDDTDNIDFIFPITLITRDFTEITVNNEEEFETLIDQCLENDDDDIECVDFKYPITFFTFNAENQQTGSVKIESDRQMHRFFEELKDDDRVSIQYPITLLLSDGMEVVVNNNTELRTTIETAKDDCDEDDDNDYNDDDFENKEQLDNYLIECAWVVTELKRENIDLTEQYKEYIINFNTDGTAKVTTTEGSIIEGTWETIITDHGPKIQLTFSELADFTLNWFIYEIENGKIKFYTEEGNRIRMEHACGIIDSNPEQLRTILKECAWIIKKVKNNNEEVDRLIGYELKFHAENLATLGNNSNTSEGTWEITVNTENRLVMLLTFENEPAVNFEWPLKDMTQERVRFEVGDYELIVERFCESDTINDGDVVEITNTMLNGNWIVASYKDDGSDETIDYNGYSFDFNTENSVAVSINNNFQFNGLWRVMRDNENHLKFILNFGDDIVLDEFNDDWEIVSITSNRIELRDISGDDGSVDTLILEK